MNSPDALPVLPWWRVPMVWLVIAGPALVVIASFVTLVLAVRGGDTPLRDAAASASLHAGTQTPATQARHHAVSVQR